jgi:organic radical activating enzyme
MGFLNSVLCGLFVSTSSGSSLRIAGFTPHHYSPSFAAMSRSLPVMEAFHTLQGEGLFTGQAAYFIRLGGCDVGCSWCDVKDSWDASKHPQYTVEAIVEEASKYPARIAVVTGGEPLMHDLGSLTEALREAGFRTHIETSGTHPLSGDWHHICFSPKKFKAPLAEIYPAAHELKVIVVNKHDLQWAEEHAAKVSAECHLYLQPEWDKRDVIVPLVVDRVMAEPRWKVSLQTHKYLNIP